MASIFDEGKFEEYLFILENLPGIVIKKEQKEALKQLVSGGDLLAVLPTGFGKSLVFQLLVLVAERLTQKKCCVLVVCPLKSIVEDQVKEAENFGINAKAISELELSEGGLSQVQLLFGSAEELVDVKFLSCLKECKNFCSSLRAVVVDESHTIETWTGLRKSKGKTSVKPFRESFGKLSSLRSFCVSGTPMGALTGTADDITQLNILKSLCLKDPLVIYVSPNRTNLRFTVKKVLKAERHKELQWLIQMAKEYGADTPKTIIFCNIMNEMASVANYLILKLGNSLYVSEDKIPENSILGIFHSNSWGKNKERLLAALKGNGKKRIIIATSALCMGVNFPDIRYIVNWGAARSILDLHQQAGRAGRDGKLSDVVIIYHGQQISPCEKEVKDFVRSSDCLRIAAYLSLDPNIEPLQPLHNCCSFCFAKCQCLGNACGAEKLPFNKTTAVMNTEPRKKRTVSARDREDLRNALIEIREQLNQQVLLDQCSGHGFADTLIEDVVKRCEEIFSLEYIVSQFPVFSIQHALAIFEDINELFLDIPLYEEYSPVVSPAEHQSFSLLDDIQFTDELFEDHDTTGNALFEEDIE